MHVIKFFFSNNKLITVIEYFMYKQNQYKDNIMVRKSVDQFY